MKTNSWENLENNNVVKSFLLNECSNQVGCFVSLGIKAFHYLVRIFQALRKPSLTAFHVNLQRKNSSRESLILQFVLRSTRPCSSTGTRTHEYSRPLANILKINISREDDHTLCCSICNKAILVHLYPVFHASQDSFRLYIDSLAWLV